jgi:hypothetical protein
MILGVAKGSIAGNTIRDIPKLRACRFPQASSLKGYRVFFLTHILGEKNAGLHTCLRFFSTLPIAPMGK